MTLIVVLIVVGLAAFLLELILPGGIVGIVGVVCLLAAIVLTFTNYGLGPGLGVTVGVFIACLLSMRLWMKHFDRLPVSRRLVLRSEVKGEPDAEQTGGQGLVGSTGVALTVIQPSGKAMIDGKKRDVTAEGSAIPKDSQVKVVAVTGLGIVVRAAE